jgi:very-short-patch-repair endonuclease
MEIFNLKKTKLTKINIKKDHTAEEKKIWDHIKYRKLYDLKFQKQYEIGRYTVNFYCPEIEFAIQINNDKHTKKYEKTRVEYLHSIGVTYLQFTSSEIKSHLEETLEKIEITVKDLKN